MDYPIIREIISTALKETPLMWTAILGYAGFVEDSRQNFPYGFPANTLLGACAGALMYASDKLQRNRATRRANFTQDINTRLIGRGISYINERIENAAREERRREYERTRPTLTQDEAFLRGIGSGLIVPDHPEWHAYKKSIMS